MLVFVENIGLKYEFQGGGVVSDWVWGWGVVQIQRIITHIYLHSMFILSFQSNVDPGADPGFPIGGAPTLIGGGANLQHRCFSVKTCVKMKEFGPVGGGGCQKLLYVDLPLRSIRFWHKIYLIFPVIGCTPHHGGHHGCIRCPHDAPSMGRHWTPHMMLPIMGECQMPPIMGGCNLSL